MAFNYSGLVTTAERLVAEYGREVTVVLESQTLADETKPWEGVTSSESSVTVPGVFYDYDSEEVDNDSVRQGDQKLVVYSATDLRNYSYVTSQGERWDIITVSQVQPGDTVVVYELQIRK